MPSRLVRGRALACLLAFLVLNTAGTVVRLRLDLGRTLIDEREVRLPSSHGYGNGEGDGNSGDDDETGRKAVAVAYITRAPLRRATLGRIYAFSSEMGGWGRSESDSGYAHYIYELVVVVDETNSRGTSEVVRKYYERRWRQRHRSGGRNESAAVAADSTAAVPLPLVFPVSETIIFEAYPKLSNYRWNGPEEVNTNNQAGECCGLPIMWQMQVPSAALFVHRHSRFDFVWKLEHDINTAGTDSLVGLARRWDEALESSSGSGSSVEVVDFAGEITTSNNVPRNSWVRNRHTPKFEQILRKMGGGVPDGEFGQWRCYTDAVQRYSRRFALHLHRHIAENVFQFGECFVHPMAWSGNYTFRALSTLLAPPGITVGGLDGLTGEKLSQEEAQRRFNASVVDGGDATFLYHEKPPPVPWFARLKPSAWAPSWSNYVRDMQHILKYEKNAAVSIFLAGSVLGVVLGVFVERKWIHMRGVRVNPG